MRRFLRFIRYVAIFLLFIMFNFILLNSLIGEKAVEGYIKPKIVLIAHVYSNPYWQYIKMGAEKAAKERNAVIDFQGPDTANIDEGIKFINMAYAAKASGIIAYVQDENRYKPIINRVVEGGVPIVTVDSDAENSNRLAYVGTDNTAAGTMAAKEMIDKVGTSGKVGIIMGGKTVKNQVERVEGFKQYIDKNSKLAISEIESSDSYLLEAELAAKKILINNWDIKALLCTSALDGEGAAKAITGLGMEGKVKIICFDDLPETLNYIEKGIITSTIVQMPYIMGYKAVNIIMDNIEGKETKGVFLTDVSVINKDNLQDFKKEQGNYLNEN